ncbi:MAG: hypothetical protein EXR79_13465 [Myxococcales bacterium]|nr:hypothetical protein [Myxococcales bacterium]
MRAVRNRLARLWASPVVASAVSMAERWSRLLGWHLAVLAVLRAVWLLRPDPFGQPLVGKVDWYWFHAVAYDAQATASWLVWLVPIALAAAWLPERWRGRLAATVALGLAGHTFAVCVVAQVDFEVVRFVGSRLNATLVRTYANVALLHELMPMLAKDAGVPFLGLTLAVVAPLGQAALQWRSWRSWRSRPGRLGGLIGVTAVAAAGWILTFFWSGAWWKVGAAAALLPGLFATPRVVQMPPGELERAAALHATRWHQMQPDDEGTFSQSAWPLLHESPYAACQAGRARMGLDCRADRDADGAPQATDCDDRRSQVHPGARDVPGDGVDQDCDGVDAQPWNFLVVVLESHRSRSTAHVPGGDDWSPRLDALARDGLAQGRAVAAALPTIGSFMALHTGLLACTHCQVATDHTLAHLPSLPVTLRRHGYYARFVSAFDPAFDNQSAWLRHWYDDVDFDRGRQDDAPLLAHVGQWLVHDAARVARGRPFFITVTTRTNHFGFDRIDGVPRTGGESWPERMRDTMGYADAALGRLIDTVRSQPWFAHTVVIVTGDHGYPLGEHGAWYLYQTLHVEAVGVPLVIVGGHPELAAFRGTLAMEPASHIDLAPTVLDLAGIESSGAWMGRSLLRRGLGTALTFKEGHIAIERGRVRLLFDDVDSADASRWQVYDRTADPRETRPLRGVPGLPALADEALWTARMMRDLYQRDAILPPEVRDARR